MFLHGKDLLFTEYQLINFLEKLIDILFNKIKFKIFIEIIRAYLRSNNEYKFIYLAP